MYNASILGQNSLANVVFPAPFGPARLCSEVGNPYRPCLGAKLRPRERGFQFFFNDHPPTQMNHGFDHGIELTFPVEELTVDLAVR
jgi:hypothetical protein